MQVKLRGKIMGHILGGTFTKTVNRRRHFFQKLQGWAFDTAVVRAMVRWNVTRIVLKVQNPKDELTVDFDEFNTNATRIDYGHGEQLVLPEHFFNKASTSKPPELTL